MDPAETAMAALPPALLTRLDWLRCPLCRAKPLVAEGARLSCASCTSGFDTVEGVPQLFATAPDPDGDVTPRVRAFYEAHPFPGYDEIDSPEQLRAKARRGVFARLLDEQLPFRARIIEVGCGTGQLANFLGLTRGRVVFGTDMCLNAVSLAERFRRRHGIDGASFVQMNLFRPVFPPASFDVVICNGVLHHTADPFGGFRSIAALVKPGGFIVIGLYNKFGRAATDARRVLFRLTGGRLWWVDPRLRDRSLGQERRLVWFLDQYRNPHESKHTMGEVLEWFGRTGFEFVSGLPKYSGATFGEDERLFEPTQAGSRLDRAIAQAGMLLSRSREGGLFVTMGRRVEAVS